MYIMLIISFLVIALTAGYLLKANLSDMLPFIWSGLVIALYVLAFGRFMNLIDFILPAVAVLLALILFYRKKKGKTGGAGFFAYAKEELTSVPVLAYFALAIIIVIGVWNKTVTWWDDINYWATDLKSLYYLNGFASKYANVSPEFGDYPPGVQLAKWFVAHANRKEFSEGLAFVGYYLFNFSFVLPIFGRKKNMPKWFAIPLALLIWLIPGMADKYGYAGFCADLSMAFIFGNILIASVDEREDAPVFDKLRIMLYLAVLVICKSTGSVWALYGIIFWMGSRICLAKKKRLSETENNGKARIGIGSFFGLLSVAIAPLIVGAGWMGFCLVMHRVTKTTSTMVTYITTDKYGLSEYTGQFASAFANAFFTQPLHADRTWIDLSPAIVLAALIALFILIYKKKLLPDGVGRFVGISLPIMGLIYYAVIFLAHITIFATETQYLEASVMIASIERYGVPFMLGSMMFVIWVWFGMAPQASGADYIRLAVFSAAVLALTNLPAAYRGLIGYRSTLEKDKNDRAEMITESSSLFLEETKRVFPEGNVRVCRLHDGGYYRVMDTYVAYEASPVSVMNISFDLSAVDSGTIINSVNQTHAVYLYADEQETAGETCLDEMVPEGKFVYGKYYYVSYEGGGMVLYPVY